VREVERSFADACECGAFRLAHFSLQHDHAHLIVEANSRDALARGMKSLAARLSRAVNRATRRRGRVLAERFHARALRTPARSSKRARLRPAQRPPPPRQTPRPAHRGAHPSEVMLRSGVIEPLVRWLALGRVRSPLVRSRFRTTVAAGCAASHLAPAHWLAA
jgi:hypothetical protein